MLFDLFAAGHETTASTLSWLFLYMANYPNVQAKIQAELKTVCGSRDSHTNDRPSLPYTEAVILETMRLRAVLPMALVHTTSKETTLNGYNVPKGTLLLPQLHLVHSNPLDFPNPTKFDPDRFIKDGCFTPHPKMIPFGYGKRRCLGEALAKVSVFVYFTRILQRFTIKRPGESKPFPEDIIYGLTISPHPYSVVLEPLL